MVKIIHHKSFGKSYECLQALSNSCDDDAYALWGTCASNIQKIKEFEKNSKDYYFIDMPYFDKLRSHFNDPGKEYWRISKNCLQVNEMHDVDDSRFKQFNLDVYDWNINGDHILLLPSNRNVEYYYNEHGWTNKVYAELKKYTDRKIIIRTKGSSRDLVNKKPLWEDIKNAHAVVTLTSIAGIEAARMGIPVFCHKDSAAAPIGLSDLSQIENPIYPERNKWLNTLAWGVFTIEEIEQGIWKR